MKETSSVDRNSLEDIVRKKLSHFMDKAENCDLENLYPVILAQVEKPLIELTLQRSEGNQMRAARMLGINRNTLRKRIQNLRIKHLTNSPKKKSSRRSSKR